MATSFVMTQRKPSGTASGTSGRSNSTYAAGNGSNTATAAEVADTGTTAEGQRFARWLCYQVSTPVRFPKATATGAVNDSVLSLFERAVRILKRLKATQPGADYVGASTSAYQTENDILLEEYLVDLLKSVHVDKVQWVYNSTRTIAHAQFYVQEEAEEVVSRLLIFAGYGSQYNSRFAVTPAQSALGFSPVNITAQDLERLFPKDNAFTEMNAALNQVAARIKLNDLVESTRRNAELSFDYLVFLVVASILAGVGLATDNAVVVVASMLVSPLMGPIVSVVFGFSISQTRMIWRGLANELISLLICIVVGIVVGFCFTPFGDRYMWPTREMASRGDVYGLIIGLAIAIPSGVGVALSVLGQNAGSLVGVAISASLLPPAVNGGMCWAYAVLAPNVASVYGPDAAPQDLNGVDFWMLGAISVALTMLNIVCVWLFALISFRIKQVPQLHNSEERSTFRNILRVREQNQQMTSKESRSLQIMEENRRLRLLRSAKATDLESGDDESTRTVSLAAMPTLTDLYHNTLTLNNAYTMVDRKPVTEDVYTKPGSEQEQQQKQSNKATANSASDAGSAPSSTSAAAGTDDAGKGLGSGVISDEDGPVAVSVSLEALPVDFDNSLHLESDEGSPRPSTVARGVGVGASSTTTTASMAGFVGAVSVNDAHTPTRQSPASAPPQMQVKVSDVTDDQEEDDDDSMGGTGSNNNTTDSMPSGRDVIQPPPKDRDSRSSSVFSNRDAFFTAPTDEGKRKREAAAAEMQRESGEAVVTASMPAWGSAGDDSESEADLSE